MQDPNSSRKDKEKKKNQLACRCKRSKCRKKYCECFENGRHCSNQCQCQDCGNKGTSVRRDDLQKPQEVIKESKEKTFCKCKKNKCSQNYCDCKSNGRLCSVSCACKGCNNQEPRSQDKSSPVNRNIAHQIEISSQNVQN